MKTNYNDIDDLLVKYLTGEATGEETTYVQQWIQQRNENQQYYDHFKLIWEESLQLAATTTVDENGAWERFQQRTQRAPVKKIQWLRIAAILIVGLGLAWMGWYLLADVNTENIPLATVITTNDVKSDTLPDGSVITINKNSSISYPERFAGKQRPVQLTGEGFFTVTRDHQKPFIVNAGNNIMIEVLGTSFNVRTRDDSTEVIVETGHVQVSWNVEKISLVAGEKVVIKNNGDSVQKEIVNDRLYNYYRSRSFVCDNTPLWKLVNILNEAYDANIIIERAGLRNEPLSTTFENQSLDSVLHIAGQTLGFIVVKENGAIILR